MAGQACPRKTPCASCPFRARVASGIWSAEEYAKLPTYDGETFEQNEKIFFCHQDEADEVCAGWLGHTDPTELLAVRIGLMIGRLDPSCAEYSTEVELFSSGTEAAVHGITNITDPGPEARTAIEKIARKRGLTS